MNNLGQKIKENFEFQATDQGHIGKLKPLLWFTHP